MFQSYCNKWHGVCTCVCKLFCNDWFNACQDDSSFVENCMARSSKILHQVCPIAALLVCLLVARFVRCMALVKDFVTGCGELLTTTQLTQTTAQWWTLINVAPILTSTSCFQLVAHQKWRGVHLWCLDQHQYYCRFCYSCSATKENDKSDSMIFLVQL